jgi:hypothetical protein
MQTKMTQKMPRVVDLDAQPRLDVEFRLGGRPVLNFVYDRDENLSINMLGDDGEIKQAVVLFDLPVKGGR